MHLFFFGRGGVAVDERAAVERVEVEGLRWASSRVGCGEWMGFVYQHRRGRHKLTYTSLLEKGPGKINRKLASHLGETWTTTGVLVVMEIEREVYLRVEVGG